MTYMIKKIISGFLDPLSLSLALILVGWFFLGATRRRKTGGLLISLGVMVLWLCGTSLVSPALMRSLEQQYPAALEVDGTPSFICVMGGDWVASKELPFSSQPDRSFLERMVEASRLAQLVPDASCIISINSTGTSEQKREFLEAWCSMYGLDSARVELLEDARDTESEVKAMAKIVQQQPALMVSSASHIPRVMMLCEMNRIDAIAAPCGHRIKSAPGRNVPIYNQLFPSAAHLARSRTVMHETSGMLWLKAKGWMREGRQRLSEKAKPASTVPAPGLSN